VPPPDEGARGQLLRMMASDAFTTARVQILDQSPELTNC
jgi:hypothetical protein